MARVHGAGETGVFQLAQSNEERLKVLCMALEEDLPTTTTLLLEPLQPGIGVAIVPSMVARLQYMAGQEDPLATLWTAATALSGAAAFVACALVSKRGVYCSFDSRTCLKSLAPRDCSCCGCTLPCRPQLASVGRVGLLQGSGGRPHFS